MAQTPMVALSFIWFSLVLYELIWGRIGVFEVFGTIIWIIFIGDFLLRFVIAPIKRTFLRNNVTPCSRSQCLPSR